MSVVCSGESSIQTAVLLQLVGRWNNKRCTVHSSKKASLAKSNYRSRLCAAPSPVAPPAATAAAPPPCAPPACRPPASPTASLPYLKICRRWRHGGRLIAVHRDVIALQEIDLFWWCCLFLLAFQISPESYASSHGCDFKGTSTKESLGISFVAIHLFLLDFQIRLWIESITDSFQLYVIQS